MCEFFIPIMRDGGRIVNVSSQSGQLQHFSVDLRQRFLQEDLTLSQLAELIYEYRVSSDLASHYTEHTRLLLPSTSPRLGLQVHFPNIKMTLTRRHHHIAGFPLTPSLA
jgi:hypothetical protein